MNAELALYLIEQGFPLDKAKEVAATGTTATELTLAILEALPGAYTVAEARVMAAEAPLPTGQARLVPSGPVAIQPIVKAGEVQGEHDTREAKYGIYTPVVGPDGLTDKQRAAVGNIGLCPNCQQPNNDHLPGCARKSGEDPKAVTKSALPPAV